jgi:hypothetical protein
MVREVEAEGRVSQGKGVAVVVPDGCGGGAKPWPCWGATHDRCISPMWGEVDETHFLF